VAGGPAEKAGIVEGDRIASINGMDVRVAREDAGDPEAAAGRVNRLERELARLKAGDTVDLMVVTGGHARAVKVTTVRIADLPAAGRAFQFGPGAIRIERRGLTADVFPRAMQELRLRLRDLPIRLRTGTIVRI
jgi:C-terminal processing protease CtpA/Prc